MTAACPIAGDDADPHPDPERGHEDAPAGIACAERVGREEGAEREHGPDRAEGRDDPERHRRGERVLAQEPDTVRDVLAHAREVEPRERGACVRIIVPCAIGGASAPRIHTMSSDLIKHVSDASFEADVLQADKPVHLAGFPLLQSQMITFQME